MVAPILDGAADYVVGSRFAGDIRRMLPAPAGRQPGADRGAVVGGPAAHHRRPVRLPGTGAVGGGRGGDRPRLQLRPGADARPAGRGARYAEVPISYGFRSSGRSFVRLGRYLRRVVPTVYRQLQSYSPTRSSSPSSGLDCVHGVGRQSTTTWPEPLAGRLPAGVVEAPVGAEARRRHPRHRQPVVGVVVGEQRLAPEDEQPLVLRRPGLEPVLLRRPTPPVHRVDVGEAAGHDLDRIGRGQALGTAASATTVAAEGVVGRRPRRRPRRTAPRRTARCRRRGRGRRGSSWAPTTGRRGGSALGR